MNEEEEAAKSDEEARARLIKVLPHIDLAMRMVKIDVPDGTVKLSVACHRPDGSGKITAGFEAEPFLEDLAKVLGFESFQELLEAES